MDVGHYELELETISIIDLKVKEPENFGEYIKRLRIQKGWSQKELASRIGAEVSTIIDWEKNRYTPRRMMIVKL